MSNINTLLPSINKRVSAAIESLDNLSTDIEKKVQNYTEKVKNQRATLWNDSYTTTLPSTFVNLLPIIGTIGTTGNDSTATNVPKKRSRLEELVIKYSGTNEDNDNENTNKQQTSSSSSSSSSLYELSSSSPAVCRPWSKTDYLQRVHTYRPSTFTLNKYYEYASPLQCSRYGFINTGSPNVLTCTWCKHSFGLPFYSSSAAAASLSSNSSISSSPSSSSSSTSSSMDDAVIHGSIRQYYHRILCTEHELQCPWKDLVCPIEFALVPIHVGKVYTTNFIIRLHNIANVLTRSLQPWNSSLTTVSNNNPSSKNSSNHYNHQWRLHPLCIPDIIVTLTTHKDTINRLIQPINQQTTPNTNETTSTDAAVILKNLCLLILWYRQITSSSSSSSASSIPLSVSSLSIMDILQLPDVLPFILTLFGWTVSSSVSASDVSTTTLSSVSSGSKRRRSSVSSLSSAKSDEGTTNNGESSSTLRCLLCDRCIDLDAMLRKDSHASAEVSIPNTASTVTPSMVQLYRERLHQNQSHTIPSSSAGVSSIDIPSTNHPRRSLMDAVKSVKAAASKAIATFTTLSSTSPTGSNHTTTVSSSATKNTNNPTENTLPLSETENIHYLHPANEHAWYCPYYRNLTTVPNESFASLVQSIVPVWKSFLETVVTNYPSVDTNKDNETKRFERIRKLLLSGDGSSSNYSSSTVSSAAVYLTFTPISVLSQTLTMMNEDKSFSSLSSSTNLLSNVSGNTSVGSNKLSSPSSSFADLYRIHHSTIPAAVASGLATLGLASVGVTDIDAITKLLIKAAEEQFVTLNQEHQQQSQHNPASSTSSSSDTAVSLGNIMKDEENNRIQIEVIKQLRCLLQQNNTNPQNEDISLDSSSMVTGEQARKSSLVLSFPMPGWLLSAYTLFVSLN